MEQGQKISGNVVEQVLLMRVRGPPSEVYCLFQFASLFQYLSSNLFQIVAELCFAPKESPKYSVGSEPG